MKHEGFLPSLLLFGLILVCYALVLGYGCSERSANRANTITSITFTKHLDEKKNPVENLSTFGSTDTIHAVVKTQNVRAGDKLQVTWVYTKGNQLVAKDSTVLSQGTNASDFHVANPAKWPSGDYKFEVSLNGTSKRDQTFKVDG